MSSTVIAPELEPARPGTLGIGAPKLPLDLLEFVPEFRAVGTTLVAAVRLGDLTCKVEVPTSRYGGELEARDSEITYLEPVRRDSDEGPKVIQDDRAFVRRVVLESDAPNVYAAIDEAIADALEELELDLHAGHDELAADVAWEAS